MRICYFFCGQNVRLIPNQTQSLFDTHRLQTPVHLHQKVWFLTLLVKDEREKGPERQTTVGSTKPQPAKFCTLSYWTCARRALRFYWVRIRPCPLFSGDRLSCSSSQWAESRSEKWLEMITLIRVVCRRCYAITFVAIEHFAHGVKRLYHPKPTSSREDSDKVLVEVGLLKLFIFRKSLLAGWHWSRE